MRRIIAFLITSLLLVSCKQAQSTQIYMNKDYYHRAGWVCEFFNDSMYWMMKDKLYPIRYVKTKPLYPDYTFDERFSWIKMDYEKEYTYIFIQGLGNNSSEYEKMGFFYDSDTYVYLYYGNRNITELFIANNAHPLE